MVPSKKKIDGVFFRHQPINQHPRDRIASMVPSKKIDGVLQGLCAPRRARLASMVPSKKIDGVKALGQLVDGLDAMASMVPSKKIDGVPTEVVAAGPHRPPGFNGAVEEDRRS